MYKPLIGITCNTMPASDVNVKNGIAAPGQDFQGLAVDYINALEKAGAIPVVLPVTNDLEGAKRIWERLDGILLSGGNDVSPELYNECIKKECGVLDHARDTYEVAAARYFVGQNRPVLGICRGIQLLNAALGGSNYQDLPSEGFERHTILDRERNEPTHRVKIEKEGLLFHILQSDEIGVNSYHHQAVHHPAESLNVEARSQDGVIEAVSVKNHPFALAVQWHPEMMFDSEQQFGLIQAFVHVAQIKNETFSY